LHSQIKQTSSERNQNHTGIANSESLGADAALASMSNMPRESFCAKLATSPSRKDSKRSSDETLGIPVQNKSSEPFLTLYYDPITNKSTVYKNTPQP
jgi:hypothetical protein